jgi:hypothetical protein
VGGRLYKVSRSLIEKFPSTTMLARMAWQKDPKATLFIGRSGERFEYSLDYMRADKVWLPLNVPKEALLDDLEFYGFEDIDHSKICGGSSNLAAARHLIKCRNESDCIVSSSKIAMQCEEVAFECFARFSRGESLDMYFSSVSALHSSAKVAIANQAEFEDHLAKYGLALVKDENLSYIRLILTEKEDVIN